MQNNYSHHNRQEFHADGHRTWCSQTLDWPCEMVCAVAQVRSSHLPDPFQWAAVRILEDFTDEPPTLDKAANELGIKDPVFLIEALDRLIESGMVERIDPATSLEFNNCRLTNLARSQTDGVTSSPERHGLTLYFDAVTGDAVSQRPSKTRAEPIEPILPPEQLPSRRTEVGLQKTRELAKDQDEPFLAGGARITDIEVLTEQGSYVWEPAESLLTIDTEGTLHCRLASATESRQQWLDGLDLKHPGFERLFTASVHMPSELTGTAVSHNLWRPWVENLIDPRSVGKEALGLLGDAESQVFLNAYWLQLPQVSQVLTALRQKGVQCVIFGRKHQLQAISEGLKDALETHELAEPTDSLHEISLQVDGSKGLSINKVRLRTPLGRQIEAFIAVALRDTHIQDLHEKLFGRTAGLQE